MTMLRLPTDLGDRYAQLADDLDGFDGPDELARYVLDATADELSRSEAADAPNASDALDTHDTQNAPDTLNAADASADRADDEVVEDRLEQLGYLEK